jgi:hypothetical protein
MMAVPGGPVVTRLASVIPELSVKGATATQRLHSTSGAYALNHMFQ